MSEGIGYPVNERRSSDGEHSEKIGYLTASLGALSERIQSMDSTMREFIKEIKDQQTAQAHQLRTDYEYLDEKIDKVAHKVSTIESSIEDHIGCHDAEEEAKKNNPWYKFSATFQDALYKALAILVLGGLGYFTLQYLTEVVAKGSTL